MARRRIERKAGEPATEVRYWLGEIAAAKKREKDFREDGEEIIAIYSGEKCDEIPFNILYSNVETLQPALFSQVPRPVVQRRFKDDDPMGKASSMAAQRMLEFLCDTNVEGYETFEQSMIGATLDGLLPGRGVTSVKYDADILDSGEEDSVPIVNWEMACTESRSWDRVYFGYAKKWSKVPWMAYEEYLDKDEAEKMFGTEVAAKIAYTVGEDDDEEEKGTGTGGRDDADNDTGSRKTALVYQIWDRAGGKVIRYISPAYHDGYLKVEDDPLELTGFFNCPRPLQFVEKSNNLTPTAMYKLYENQAKELNRLTTRLQKVVSALKVRGAYDGALGKDIESILNEDDNALIPTDSASSLATEKGFGNAIWFMPLNELMVVAEKLVQAREACKRVIYEITGVSDIIRGQSMASETLGAQKIKEAWGTMRLKRMQKYVQRYCRDTLRIMLEIAASKFSEKTWARATGLPFATSEQKAQAQMIAQASQAMGQEPDPQTMQVLQAPGWDDILKMLRDDVQRAYRIDIETNSTIDVEATEDQQQVGNFMNAMGQLLAGLNPLVEKGIMPFDAAKSMMLAVVRRFRFGTEVEEDLKAMQQPKPQGNPEADQAKSDMAALQQESQAKMAELQQKHASEQQALMADMKQRRDEMQMEMQRIAAEAQAEREKLIAEFKTEAEKANAQYRIKQMEANIQRDTELKKAALSAAAQIEIARMGAAKDKETESSGESMMMSGIVATQNRLLEIIAAPKVGTLSNGKKIMIETHKTGTAE